MPVLVAIVVGVLLFFFLLPRNPLENVLFASVVGGALAHYVVERVQADKAHCKQQSEFQKQIFTACEDSLEAFEAIPKHLLSAEELLDVAEHEFHDGAFSPFWDSIEREMGKLGAVDSQVKLISNSSKRYRQLAASYEGRPPPFPVDSESARRLATANETSGRLKKLVREAQRDFHFATIYEQRKTSAILIAGFNNLGDAIYGLGDRLQDSINGLGNELSSSLNELTEKVGSGLSELTERQEKAVAMLDNIQRLRIPPKFAQH